MSGENPNKQDRGNLDCTFLDKLKLVSQATVTVSGPPIPDRPDQRERESVDTAGVQPTSSHTEKAELVHLSFLQRL